MFILFYFLESACWRCHLLTTNICGNSQGERKILRLLGNRFFSWCRQVYFYWSKTDKLLSKNVQKCFSIYLSDAFPEKSLSKNVFPNILNPLLDRLSHQHVWEDRKRANSVIMMMRDANIMMLCDAVLVLVFKSKREILIFSIAIRYYTYIYIHISKYV